LPNELIARPWKIASRKQKEWPREEEVKGMKEFSLWQEKEHGEEERN
jgi:hypothetical protein